MGPNQNSTPLQPTTPSAPNVQPQTQPQPQSAPSISNTVPVAKPVTQAAPATPADTTDKKEGSVGALIGSIIIVIIIVLGGLYFWGKALEKKNTPPVVPASGETSFAPAETAGDNVSTSAEATTLTQLPPSNSLSADDEIAQIEAALADLQSINSNSELATLGE